MLSADVSGISSTKSSWRIARHHRGSLCAMPRLSHARRSIVFTARVVMAVVVAVVIEVVVASQLMLFLLLSLPLSLSHSAVAA